MHAIIALADFFFFFVCVCVCACGNFFFVFLHLCRAPVEWMADKATQDHKDLVDNWVPVGKQDYQDPLDKT